MRLYLFPTGNFSAQADEICDEHSKVILSKVGKAKKIIHPLKKMIKKK